MSGAGIPVTWFGESALSSSVTCLPCCPWSLREWGRGVLFGGTGKMSQKEPRGLSLSLVSLGAELYTAISLCFSSPEENTVGVSGPWPSCPLGSDSCHPEKMEAARDYVSLEGK